MSDKLPYLDYNLKITTDYILATKLCRKALEAFLPGGIANIIRDILKSIDTLALSCHLPEFTDHALSHLMSIVNRASKWTIADGTFLVENLEPFEAALLMLSLLTHDMGMLSQNPLDLGKGYSQKGMTDVATWVRYTHCSRLPRLLERILKSNGYNEFAESDFFNLLCYVAMAHEEWSWQTDAKHYPKIIEKAPFVGFGNGFIFDGKRACGIAAVLAVCDLLDEDSQRCDTDTLILHRQGTPLNKAHWIRHLLTNNRVMIQNNKFSVAFKRLRYKNAPSGKDIDSDPSGCQDETRFDQVIKALKNQFSSALLYNDDLRVLGAELLEPEYCESNDSEPILWNLPALGEFWGCAPERLLQSVFSFAREPDTEIKEKWKSLRGSAKFNELDMNLYYRFLGISSENKELLLKEEIIFNSILDAKL
ncbi:MAG: hypothetical protein GY795_51200 [Desulfobacterales bacterium]|nr:hypothetical protein [Desulfobacterales bacterium]